MANQVPVQTYPSSSFAPKLVCTINEHNDTSLVSPNDLSSDEEPDEPDSLRELVYNKLVKSTFVNPPHQFVPEGVLDELITEGAIRDYLQIAHPKDTDLVEFIRVRAKKAFTTMVMV
jgi:hypothetical protein